MQSAREAWGVIQPLPLSSSKCGYCGSKKGSVIRGAFTDSLRPEVYQRMIDAGWRRSGDFCYLPNLERSCCQQRTIRLDVTEYKPSKEQRRALKRFEEFLEPTEKPTRRGGKKAALVSLTEVEPIRTIKGTLELKLARLVQAELSKPVPVHFAVRMEGKTPCLSSSSVISALHGEKRGQELAAGMCAMLNEENIRGVKECISSQHGHVNAILDSGIVRAMQKQMGEVEDSRIHAERVIGRRRELDIKLKPSEFTDEAFRLYQRYQMAVHRDKEEDLTQEQYTRFLVEGCVEQEEEEMEGHKLQYGQYHMEYRLEGKLVAVGVVDILPLCLSSVYFFYDPSDEYKRLSLGRIGAMKEIEFVQDKLKNFPAFRYYYMGYYIHNCPKMRYKAEYMPSTILCRNTLSWHYITQIVVEGIDLSVYNKFLGGEEEANEQGLTAANEERLRHAKEAYLSAGQSLIVKLKRALADRMIRSFSKNILSVATELGRGAENVLLVFSPSTLPTIASEAMLEDD